MNKNYRIKMICLLCAFAATISSCKKSELLEEKPLNNKHNGLAAKADGVWDVLGYGYNATKSFMDDNSLSDVPIIDVSRFANDYIDRLDIGRNTEGSQDYSMGISVTDYLKEINNKRSYGIDPTWGDKESTKKAYFSLSIKRNKEDYSKTAYSSRFSYATFEAFMRIKRIRFTGDANIELLKKYLKPEFLNNIATQSGETLVKRYGTHVLMDISLGGHYRFDYSGSIIKTTDYEKKIRAVKISLFGGLLKCIGINANAETDKEEITQILNENTNKNYTLKFVGGTNSGRSITFDSNFNSSESFNISGWEQGINERNCSLINVERAIPLYDLIDDPAKKQEVIAAVRQHIENSQIKELGEVPVFGHYNPRSGDHYYTVHQENHSDYLLEGLFFYAFSRSDIPNTIPIYRYYNRGNGDHFYTSSSQTPQGYISEGISFYAYNKLGNPNSTPLYRFYNRGNGDHYYATSPEVPQGYRPEGIECYIISPGKN